MNEEYWVCIIGPIKRNKLPHGADSPPRQAAQRAILNMTQDADFHTYSGWGCDEETFNKIMKAWH